jgi:hypothetical protein
MVFKVLWKVACHVLPYLVIESGKAKVLRRNGFDEIPVSLRMDSCEKKSSAAALTVGRGEEDKYIPEPVQRLLQRTCEAV